MTPGKEKVKEVLAQLKLEEDQKAVEWRKDFKEGLEFLDEKVVPALEEFNKSVLEDKGYVTLEIVEISPPTYPPDLLKPQAILEWREPNQRFDNEEVRTLSVAVQFSPKIRVNLPFSKKDAPALLIYGKSPQGLGEIPRTAFIGGGPGEDDESFQVPILNEYTETRPASDWIPEFVSVIKGFYEDYGIPRVSVKFHKSPEDIQQFEQTIRAIDEESMARGRRKSWVVDRSNNMVRRKSKEEILSELKTFEKSVKEKAPTPEQSRAIINNTVEDINKKVFSGRLLVQEWQEEESLHQHVTGGRIWTKWEYHDSPIRAENHYVKAYVFRITLPNNRVIRLFMETGKENIFVDQYDNNGEEPELCTYTEKLLDSCGQTERDYFLSSSKQAVKKIVFTKVVEEYVKKTLVNRV